MNTDFYIKQLNRRRTWEIIPVSPNQKIVEGAEDVLQRALAISALECPVGDFIDSEIQSNTKIPTVVKSLLEANRDDEIKHDKALSNLQSVFPVKQEYLEDIEGVVKEAKELGDLINPVVVAGALEASIFFVVLPMYRFLGGSGFRTIANDISNDENIHVATNLQFAKDLGYNRIPRLNKLRRAVIDWLTISLDWENDNKYLSGSHWATASDNLYHSGKAPQLRETRRAVMPSFFEKNNLDLPKYG